MNQGASSATAPAAVPAFDTWPGMDLTYHYSAGPRLNLSFRLDVSRYDAATDTMWREQADRDSETYAARLRQWEEQAEAVLHLRSTLNPETELPFAVGHREQIAGFLRSIVAYLEEVSREAAGTAPGALLLSWEVAAGAANAASLFELQVSVERSVTTAEEDGEPSVEIQEPLSSMAILPRIDADAVEAEALWGFFAAGFAEAFPAREAETLLPATGGVPEGSTDGELGGLWVLRLGTDRSRDAWVEIGAPAPTLMRPPLLRLLLSGAVNVPVYVPGEGLLPATVEGRFSAIDGNVWANNFLDALDRVMGDGAGRKRLAVACDASLFNEYSTLRERLAELLSAGHEAVYGDETPEADALASARKALRLRLEECLSAAHDAVITYPFTGGGNFPDGAQAWLAGTRQVPGDGFLTNHAPHHWQLPLRPLGQEAWLALLLAPPADVTRSSAAVAPLHDLTHIGLQSAGGTGAIAWLRLLNKPAGAAPFNPLHLAPGETILPLPQRVYPSAIALHQQQALAGPLAPLSVASACSWRYALAYGHEKGPQDRFYATLQLDRPLAPSAVAPRTQGGAFFEALACFNTCQPQVQADIENFLQKPDEEASSPEALRMARVALEAFVRLAADVVAAWPAQPGAGIVPDQTGSPEYSFSIAESREADGTLKVTAKGGAAALSLQVEIPGYKSRPVADQPGSWTFAGGAGDLSFEAARTLSRQLVWDGLRVPMNRQATATLRMRRNEQVEGRALNPKFVFDTPLVTFKHTVAPSLDEQETIGAASWMTGQGPWTLDAVLEALFRTLLPAGFGSCLIRVGCSYRYPLAAGGVLPDVELPVLLLPLRQFEEQSDFAPAAGCKETAAGPGGPFVCALAQGCRTWLAQTAPPREGGSFVLDVTLLSDNETQAPLLHLHSLRIALALLRDLPV
ncbi:hypothetical protein [Flaviaesturariibacter aridisoli]|uniref:Uncharacterized protein n=1 Tax=Flaviaesturariibacter aridisoli TaxID=2545761 RepID=A0A4R4E2I1_9BACT|nr:hypothetical protein [Flaviaesturariibacter aridisoli]TCZ69605.1 hypothetical protein E0486_12310 [Flaviaesturariibacter aridisoli]